MGYKNVRTPNPKALAPAEENMTLSMKQGEELMKIMKERGSKIHTNCSRHEGIRNRQDEDEAAGASKEAKQGMEAYLSVGRFL